MKKETVHLENKVDWFQDTSLKWSVCAAAFQLLTRRLTDQETPLQGVPRDSQGGGLPMFVRHY